MPLSRLFAFIVLISILVTGCKSQPNPAGTYKVEVPQNGSQVAVVGKLVLKEDGNFTMNSGQLEMNGTWIQDGDEIKFTSGNAGAKMLSAQRFRIDGKTLVPVGETGDQKHWRMTRE
jgi:hypothetical protein